jgi:HK97 gp10 family phage protein
MATVKVEGFSDLEKALEDLSKAAGKGVLRRSLIKAATPLADLAETLAPERTGGLKKSMAVSTKLAKRQQGIHNKMFRDDRSSVEVFAGPSYDLGDGGRHGHLVEFGTYRTAPQPFMRPAWDQEGQATLDRLGRLLWDEFAKSMARAERKAAKLAKG